MRPLRVLSWNLQWAIAASAKGKSLKARIESFDPDLMGLTETLTGFLSNGHVVESNADYGYPPVPGRRKILLWSRRSWSEVDRVGHRLLPPGRFVSAVTLTGLGRIRVVAVCIPWADAHVSTGRRDRERWDEHLLYLEHLRTVLTALPTDPPVIIVGDFNQTVPRTRAPTHVYAALQHAFQGFETSTAGIVPPLTHPVLDHVALSPGLHAVSTIGIGNRTGNGVELTDHTGVVVDIQIKAADRMLSMEAPQSL